MHTYLKGCVVLCIFAATLVQGQTNSSQESSDTVELSRLEKVWNEAHIKGDADSLEALWSEDLVVTVPKMQIMGKPETIAFLRSGRMKFQRYETSDIQIRVYGDTAIVTGRLLRTRTVNDRELKDDWRFTKVYVQRFGKWQVVAWHASESAPQ